MIFRQINSNKNPKENYSHKEDAALLFICLSKNLRGFVFFLQVFSPDFGKNRVQVATDATSGTKCCVKSTPSSFERLSLFTSRVIVVTAKQLK